MTIKTTDLSDQFEVELEDQMQTASTDYKLYGKQKSFGGLMATVRVHEDNILVQEALDTVDPGTVLVVDGGGSRRCALLGDRLAGIAASRGLAGIIINGCVRDVVDLANLEMGILALGSSPKRSAKAGNGERNVNLEFEGLQWIPGHYVYVDDDGILISPRPLI